MTQIQVQTILQEHRKFEGNVIEANKRFIDLKDFEMGLCSMLKINHTGVTTLINVASLGRHVLLVLDEKGSVISRMICKSNPKRGDYILSIQEKNLLFLSQDIGVEEWGNITSVRLG